MGLAQGRLVDVGVGSGAVVDRGATQVRTAGVEVVELARRIRQPPERQLSDLERATRLASLLAIAKRAKEGEAD